MFQRTTALNKILEALASDYRGIIVQGGTSAGKTIAILLGLIDTAQTKECTVSVTSESLPHLKRGAMRDFLNIMKSHNYYDENRHNKTDFLYEFGEGYMEFFGADDPSKLRGPRRDILFINEANNVSKQVFEQLEVRTRWKWVVDYNPTSEFWAHELVGRPGVKFLKLTYKDNEALEQSIIDAIESRKENTNWWKVYGLGEVGQKEGQIYPEWEQIDAVPDTAKLVRRGLDFGYTNHPTVLEDIHEWNNALVIDQQLYRTGMKNPQIAEYILDIEKDQGFPDTLVVADSAEPKSIDELKDLGVNVIGAPKGPGSVNAGIDNVLAKKIYITKRSVETIKENRNYLWKTDKDGNPLNVPEKAFDHAMDAIRYAMSDLVHNTDLEEEDIAIV